jgi:Tol biopolymer transport system component
MNTIDGIRSSAQIGFGGSPTWVQGKAPLDFGDQIAFGNMPPPDWIPIHLDADVPSSSFQQVPEMRKVRVLPNLYRIFPDGSGGSWLHLSPDAEFPNDWLDNFVLYTRTTNATATLEDLFVQPRSEAPVVPVANSPARELNGRFSPKGDWIVYQSNEAGDRFEIYVQAFPGSARFRKDVSHKGGTNPQWRRKDGREIYFLSSDNDVMAAPVTPSADGRDIEIGAPVALFPAPAGTGFDASSDGERFLINAPVDDTGPPIRILTDWAPTSLSAPGALSARPPQPAPTTSATAARSNTNGGPIAGPLKQITIFDKNGNRLRAVGIPGLWDQIAISPDATQVAFSRGTELFVVDTRTDTTSTITVDLLRNTSFGFSPGSQYIAFVSTVRPSELRPTTTSPTVILTRMFSNGIGVQSRAYPGVTNFSNWSTDFYMLNSGNRQLAVAPNRTLPAVSLAVAGGNTPLRLSPNSRYIAYVSNEDGSPQVWVRPFNPASTAPLSAAVKITTDGAGGMVRWRADGQELYYLSSDGRIMAVPITTRPEIKAGPSTPLFRLPLGVGIDGDISADGQRFVFLEYVPAATSGR